MVFPRNRSSFVGNLSEWVWERTEEPLQLEKGRVLGGNWLTPRSRQRHRVSIDRSDITIGFRLLRSQPRSDIPQPQQRLLMTAPVVGTYSEEVLLEMQAYSVLLNRKDSPALWLAESYSLLKMLKSM